MIIKMQDKYVEFVRKLAKQSLPTKPKEVKQALLAVIVEAGLLDREYKHLQGIE